MPKKRTQAEVRIARQLKAAGAGSPYEVSAGEVRAWAINYLSIYDEEVAESPDLLGKPHWDLWMKDDRLEDALFAVLVFGDTTVQFICGTGDPYAIRKFAGRNFPADVYKLTQAMEKKFTTPLGTLVLSRKAVEAWLGRSW
jgi:hypothetical protein